MAVKPDVHCTNGCSPSSAGRWTECSGSVGLSKGFQNKTHEITDIGSYCHELAAYKVAKAMRLRAEKPTSVYDTEDADVFTDEYRDIVMKIARREINRCPNAKVLIEQRVSIDEFIPGTFGTCDLAIVSKGKLYVIDAKFGFKEVSPIKNKQLSIYSLGLLTKYREEYGIEKVVLGIYQPRIQRRLQTYETTAKRLLNWGETKLKVVGKEILSGNGKLKVGDYCDYCPALSHCRKHYEVLREMEDLKEKEPNKLTDDELTQVLENADGIIAFIESVKEYAVEKMLEGKEYKNFKLVEGRSLYKFTDEEEVARQCKNAGYEDIYKTSLISVAEMKKLMGKEEFNKVLGKLVVRPQGKAVIAKLSDKRPALDLASAKQEFNDKKGD